MVALLRELRRERNGAVADSMRYYGAASYYGHELTGICKAARLNVVDVTQDERQYNSVPVDWYVIEQTNIDGIVIWQTASGTIYETCPGSEADKICDSLEEYISLE